MQIPTEKSGLSETAQNFRKKNKMFINFGIPSSQPLSFIQTIQGNRSWNQFEEKYSQDRGFHVVSTDPTCFYLCQEASPKNSRPLVGWDILLCEEKTKQNNNRAFQPKHETRLYKS